MLFNSYGFILGYLPITLAGYLLLVRWAPNACVVWLSAASVAFYAGWNPRYVPLLLASVVFNYACSRLIVGQIRKGYSIEELIAEYPYLDQVDIVQALGYVAQRPGPQLCTRSKWAY